MTLNTKLTEREFADVERFCEAHAVAFSEWVREVVLREVRSADRTQSGRYVPRCPLPAGHPTLRGTSCSPTTTAR